jgi:hypothetical protein
VKTYTLPFARTVEHIPDHPERTAYRQQSSVGLDFDYTYQVWPSEAAMRKTIELQARREPKQTDWRAWKDSNMARRLGK